MRSVRKGWAVIVTIAAVTAVVFGLATTRNITTAQTGAQAAPGRIAGKPDFSGVWEANNTANWDLQTHSARPMVAQPGFVPNTVTLAAPVLGLSSIK